MSDYNRAIRKFERLAFRGVPEKPEPNYQRNLNADVGDRLTRKSQLSPNQGIPADRKLRKLADVVFYPDVEEIEVRSPEH